MNTGIYTNYCTGILTVNNILLARHRILTVSNILLIYWWYSSILYIDHINARWTQLSLETPVIFAPTVDAIKRLIGSLY
jgi:hypothetical protein